MVVCLGSTLALFRTAGGLQIYTLHTPGKRSQTKMESCRKLVFVILCYPYAILGE